MTTDSNISIGSIDASTDASDPGASDLGENPSVPVQGDAVVGGSPLPAGSVDESKATYGRDNPNAWPGPPRNPNPPVGVLGDNAELNPNNQAGNLDQGGPDRGG